MITITICNHDGRKVRFKMDPVHSDFSVEATQLTGRAEVAGMNGARLTLDGLTVEECRELKGIVLEGRTYALPDYRKKADAAGRGRRA